MPALYSNPGVVGYMPMPVSFHYRSAFLQGRPRHERFDDFWRKHPPMDHVHRAKIFSPFDALAGFDECIESKLVLYTEKRMLSEEERGEINSALNRLHSLTCNSKAARENRPQATVEYFVPCEDMNSGWYGIGGRYNTITGVFWKVDPVKEQITIDEKVIPLNDIAEIRFPE